SATRRSRSGPPASRRTSARAWSARWRGACAKREREERRAGPRTPSDEEVLVLFRDPARRRAVPRLQAAQLVVDLDPAPYPLQEGRDVHEGTERLHDHAPDHARGFLDLLYGVGQEVVDATGLQGHEVRDLREVAGDAGQVVEGGADLA